MSVRPLNLPNASGYARVKYSSMREREWHGTSTTEWTHGKKRERAKPAYHVYLNMERTRYVDVPQKAYEAIDLPVVYEEFGMFKLQYRNIVLPDRFVGNGFDEIPVASAMEKYRTEAVRFAEQVMLATGYFNTHLPTEKPQAAINYTSLRLSYSNDIEFHFVADRSPDGMRGRGSADDAIEQWLPGCRPLFH